MSDWEKHVIPDWVVDDYNSRVSEEDRLPLRGGNTTTDSDIDDYFCSATNTERSSHSNTTSTQPQHSGIFSGMIIGLILLLFIFLVIKFPAIIFIIAFLTFLSWVYS